MATVKPFVCVRTYDNETTKIVAALPYDVYSRKEACSFVAANPRSFLAIDRAETQFDESVDTYADCVYQKASSMLEEWKNEKIFITDKEKSYYIYELTMNGRSQTGIVAVASIDDYLNGIIKKHENTREDKELDRINHVDICSAQTGPIFLAYRSNKAINEIVNKVKEETPLYDFVSEDGIKHRVFKVLTELDNEILEKSFSNINEIYIADGHHRAASAVKVGLKRREKYPNYTGEEDFNYFLSVLFPDEELMIMDYNRVIKSLKGLSEEAFLKKVSEIFMVSPMNNENSDKMSAPVFNNKSFGEMSDSDLTNKTEEVDYRKPGEKGTFSMYLGKRWYKCAIKDSDRSKDPVKGLDVSLLQDLLLEPVLGIKDPKTDKSIDFVGGIRGLDELERRCNEDCVCAFAMYPTSIRELFDVADAGLLMPPKSTWFEPKLRSGIFIHEIER